MSQEINHTGSRTTRLLGAAVIVGLVALVVLGWFVAPEDDEQQDAVRMIFVHVPSALFTYIAFMVTAAGSVMWLIRRSIWWDTVAAAAAAVVFVLGGLVVVSADSTPGDALYPVRRGVIRAAEAASELAKLKQERVPVEKINEGELGLDADDSWSRSPGVAQAPAVARVMLSPRNLESAPKYR